MNTLSTHFVLKENPFLLAFAILVALAHTSSSLAYLAIIEKLTHGIGQVAWHCNVIHKNNLIIGTTLWLL